jgi:hypothetical protein
VDGFLSICHLGKAFYFRPSKKKDGRNIYYPFSSHFCKNLVFPSLLKERPSFCFLSQRLRSKIHEMIQLVFLSKAEVASYLSSPKKRLFFVCRLPKRKENGTFQKPLRKPSNEKSYPQGNSNPCYLREREMS